MFILKFFDDKVIGQVYILYGDRLINIFIN